MKMTEDKLHNQGYELHHTACRRGYIRADELGTVLPYKGRFGEGYIRLIGMHYHFGSCKPSTMYEDIEYWVK